MKRKTVRQWQILSGLCGRMRYQQNTCDADTG